MIEVKQVEDSVVVKLRIQPRSSKNEVMVYGDALKIRLTCPPVDGKANVQCISFISESLAISKNRIEIISGTNGRDKRVKITGITREYFFERVGICLKQ